MNYEKTTSDVQKIFNRVMDRNKPLFLFNSKPMPPTEALNDNFTPSFSMVTLL